MALGYGVLLFGAAAVNSVQRRQRAVPSAEVSAVVPVPSAPVERTELSLPDLFEIELRAGVDESVQKELGELMNLAPDVERCGQRHLLVPLRYAIKAILLEPANLTLAKAIREDIEERVRAVPVLRGLWALLGVVAVVVVVLRVSPLPETIFGFSRSTLLLVVVAGAVGAFVSVLVRIREFVINPERSSVWTGFFRPVIGIAFALFVFMVFEAGLLPFEIERGRENAWYAVIGFLAGFSERFVSGVIRHTETRIVPLPTGSTLGGPAPGVASHPAAGSEVSTASPRGVASPSPPASEKPV